METNTKENDLSIDDQLNAEIEMHATKLLMLIQDSTMPDDVKESFIVLLPYFSLEQMDRLLNILEAMYLDGKTKDIDEKLKQDLQKVVDEFEANDQENQAKFINQLNLISKGI